MKTTIDKIPYLSEPSLNSELILINNSKKLKQDKTLYNDKYLKEIEELRNEYEFLDTQNTQGLQKKKRDIRNRIRDLSSITYVNRDNRIFGDMIIKIIDNILTRQNFSGYSYKDEMKSLAIEHILKYTWKFNSYRKSKISGQYISAFTYISTIIFNAFVATINKQNFELQKAKEDFLETQKLFHRDPNKSTIESEHSEIGKVVNISSIDTSIYDFINNKMVLDETDILIKYPKKYKISIEEYKKITEFSKNNNICLSLIRKED